MTAAATKFRCSELIAENTVCSDLVGRVTLSFLQQREVGTACGEFYRDVENLGLTPDNDGGCWALKKTILCPYLRGVYINVKLLQNNCS